MKNIHILPTNKPSRLNYSKVKTNREIDYKLELKQEYSKCNNGLLSGPRNIYIISDEEIKSKCWVLNIVNNSIYKTYKGGNFQEDNEKEKWRKIILTTDQDLIKDGVQAIDDEFLEWFVKNPNCESVVVERVLQIGDLTQLGEIFDTTISWKFKGRTLYYCGKSKTKGIWKLEEELVVNNFKNTYKIIIPKEEHKQETLEEAALKFTAGKSVTEIQSRMDFVKGATFGAKWQQERMCSEEDLRQAFRDGQENMNYSETYGLDSKLTEQKWFEQFKKK